MDHGYFGVVHGRPGVGKSMILKDFIRRLDPSEYNTIEMQNTNINGAALLRSLVRELGEKPGRGRDTLYLQISSRLKCMDKTLILLIDNAELLEMTAFTDLRLLVGLSPLHKKPLKIILCGLDEIDRMLRREQFSDLYDRINIRIPVYPMDEPDTINYIDYRLKKAGGNSKCIPAEVKTMVYQYSGGVMRKVNNIMTACFISAASLNQSIINERTVRLAVKELGMM